MILLILKNKLNIKIELKEKENEFSEDLSQGADEKPSFKSKFSKFLSTAKEKALYYLGFEDDEEYDDDVIFSTSSGVERLKNANHLILMRNIRKILFIKRLMMRKKIINQIC